MKKGIYKHYKNKLYEVLGTVRHSETLEELVLYKALYHDKEFGENALWVRPIEMFGESLQYKGENVLRFTYIGNKSYEHLKTS